MVKLDETHDASLTSWVSSANTPETEFPIQNLPFASFRRSGSQELFRGGVAIGDQVLDLAAVARSGEFAGAFPGVVQQAIKACSLPTLNKFMSMGCEAWMALRIALSRALRSGSELQAVLQPCLLEQSKVEYQLPCQIGDFTDFYASIHHARNAGRLYRSDEPLLPNYKWVPVAYHGRSSSIGISGQKVRRPQGQFEAKGPTPDFGPTRRLDFELEMGVFVGSGNKLGEAVSIGKAEEHIFGFCLLNDWSARDIQGWEYRPLGPFLAKNFATTISPWIVTTHALAPFRVPFERDRDDPQPLPYLNSPTNSASGAFDITLQCLLSTRNSIDEGRPETLLSTTNFRHCYWTAAQMVAHHTVNGCNLNPGDLLGTGTQSDPDPDQAGSLLELTRGGQQPLTFANGEQRRFLEDGDTVIIRGHCEREGARRIGFGEVRGTVLPATE